MYEIGADWMIHVNPSLRFGKWGGLDFIDHLERQPQALVLESTNVFGWHLIAFSRRVLDAVGLYDCWFSPYGYDDLDMSWRIQKAFTLDWHTNIWEKVPVEVEDVMMGHTLKLTKMQPPDNNDLLRQYYMEKWGSINNPDAMFTHPYNESSRTVRYWRPTPQGDTCGEA